MGRNKDGKVELLLKETSDLNAEVSYKNKTEIIEPARVKAEKDSAKKQKNKRRKLVTVVSSVGLVLVLLIVLVVVLTKLPWGKEVEPGTTGGQRISEFMHYEGPIMPLQVDKASESIWQENFSTIKVERNLKLDFHLGAEESQEFVRPISKLMNVQDVYEFSDLRTLKNLPEEEEKIKLIYPFVADCEQLYFAVPNIYLNDEKLNTNLYLGDSTEKDVATEDSLNWEDYQEILNKGQDLDKARQENIQAKNIPVHLYSFSNTSYPEEVDVPSLFVKINSEKTQLLASGFEGFTDAGEEKIFSTFISAERESKQGRYILVIGEDLEAMEVGIQDPSGKIYSQTEVDLTSLEAKNLALITRQELNLDQALEIALEPLYDRYKERVDNDIDSKYRVGIDYRLSSEFPYLDFTEFRNLYIRDLLSFGTLSDDSVSRYETHFLDEMNITNVKRVFYLEFELDLQQIRELDEFSLNLDFNKYASYNYFGADADTDKYGYELIMEQKHALPLVKQKVAIADYGKIEIVEQNLGFDLAKGEKGVVLEDDSLHYYLNVKAK